VPAQSIVGSQSFPYNSPSGIIRHALKRHFEWLEGIAPFPTVYHRTNAILEILKEEEEADRFAAIIDRLSTQVGSYLARGDITRARAIVHRILDEIAEMPDGGWKEQYQSEVHHRFGYLLQQQTTTSLINLMEGDDDGY